MASDGPTNPGAWAGLKELGPQIAVWAGLLAGMIGSLFTVGYKFRRHGERIEALELGLQAERSAREHEMDKQMNTILARLDAHQDATTETFRMISRSIGDLAAAQAAATAKADDGRSKLYQHVDAKMMEVAARVDRAQDKADAGLSEIRNVVHNLSSSIRLYGVGTRQQQGEEE